MKTFALTAAIAATLAAPAFADASYAIQHFNQDVDQVTEQRLVPADDAILSVSTSGASNLGVVFAQFNMDADTASDLRGLNGATVALSTASGTAGDIFALIRAESLEAE